MQIHEAKQLLLRAIQNDDYAMILQITARMEHVAGWDLAVHRSVALWRAMGHMALRQQKQFSAQLKELEETLAQLQARLQGHGADHESSAPWLDVDNGPVFDVDYAAGYEAGYAAGYDAASAQRFETVVRLICHPMDN